MEINWDSGQATITINQDCYDQLIEKLSDGKNKQEDIKENFEYISDKMSLQMYNQIPNIFFFEESFLTHTKNIVDIFERYVEKELEQIEEFYIIFEDLEIKKLKVKKDHRHQQFIEQLDQNNISTLAGVSNNTIMISPFILNEIKNEYNNTEIFSNKLNKFIEFLSLIFLSEKTIFTESKTSFIIYNERNSEIIKEVNWNDDELSGTSYFDMLNWILIDNGLGINSSTKLKIIRNWIKEKGSISDVHNFKDECEDILNRIINLETREYFHQIKQLKDEFLEFTKLELEANRVLSKNMLTVIISIAVGIFYKIGTEMKFPLFKPNKLIGLMFIFSIIALVFFGVTYIFDFYQRKKIHEKLESFYVHNLHINKDIFNKYLPEPKLLANNVLYSLLFFLLLLILVLSAVYYLDLIFCIKKILIILCI